MDKTITVTQFVEQFSNKKGDMKMQFVDKHIVSRYVPYEKKCDECSRIIKSSSRNDKGEFFQNLAARYMLYSLTLIDLYTDIIVDFGKSLEEFNLLDKNGLVDIIVGSIDQTEHAKFDTLLNMFQEDYYENNRSVSSLVSGAVKRVETIGDKFAEALNAALDDKTMTAIKNNIQKTLSY